MSVLEDMFVWPGEGRNPHTRNKISHGTVLSSSIPAATALEASALCITLLYRYSRVRSEEARPYVAWVDEYVSRWHPRELGRVAGNLLAADVASMKGELDACVGQAQADLTRATEIHADPVIADAVALQANKVRELKKQEASVEVITEAVRQLGNLKSQLPLPEVWAGHLNAADSERVVWVQIDRIHESVQQLLQAPQASNQIQMAHQDLPKVAAVVRALDSCRNVLRVLDTELSEMHSQNCVDVVTRVLNGNNSGRRRAEGVLMKRRLSPVVAAMLQLLVAMCIERLDSADTSVTLPLCLANFANSIEAHLSKGTWRFAVARMAVFVGLDESNELASLIQAHEASKIAVDLDKYLEAARTNQPVQNISSHPACKFIESVYNSGRNQHSGRWRMASCLLYTSDAADEEDSVDLGGRRIIKKKKKR
eukprot:TRINITY_DN1197_c0_g1_i7.p1 TRINITY_DN1197_c0_g1~~TRINITY_DN1197_c0_g1_i7.p1  ORF type:complete len:425 (-),score=111.93 TRINITY_DN1197_c0_g1_i7:44-1318(-)